MNGLIRFVREKRRQVIIGVLLALVVGFTYGYVERQRELKDIRERGLYFACAYKLFAYNWRGNGIYLV